MSCKKLDLIVETSGLLLILIGTPIFALTAANYYSFKRTQELTEIGFTHEEIEREFSAEVKYSIFGGDELTPLDWHGYDTPAHYDDERRMWVYKINDEPNDIYKIIMPGIKLAYHLEEKKI
jgi:hypothetical protein